MKLTLVRESQVDFDCWYVKDEKGKDHIVDLCVDNSLVRPFLKTGVVVEVDYLQPHVEIAVGVQVLTN
jgi:hypothetical protein